MPFPLVFVGNSRRIVAVFPDKVDAHGDAFAGSQLRGGSYGTERLGKPRPPSVCRRLPRKLDGSRGRSPSSSMPPFACIMEGEAPALSCGEGLPSRLPRRLVAPELPGAGGNVFVKVGRHPRIQNRDTHGDAFPFPEEGFRAGWLGFAKPGKDGSLTIREVGGVVQHVDWGRHKSVAGVVDPGPASSRPATISLVR